MHVLISILAAIVAAVAALVLAAPPAAAGLCAVLGAAAGYALARPAAPSAIAIAASEPDDAGLSVSDLIEAIDDPVLLVDRQRVSAANAAALRLLGDHAIGQDVRLAIRHPAAAERLVKRLDAGHAPLPPIALVGIGELERRWELSVHRLDDHRRLARLADRTGAHAAEQMRVDFVANASHELRTPLATLLGFIETLEDRNAAEDAGTRARFLKIMLGEAKRMQRLVEDLMSLSRIEAEKYSVPQQPVPLAALVEEARGAARSPAGDDGARIRIASADETPAVLGDKAQLSQLVQNLVGNALKYGRAGTPVTVSIRPAANNMVQLIVADEGEGIAAEHIPRLTERFYRADPGRSRALGGTGLGLAIVKHIVERHRGRLDISSLVGQGTKVSVMLPAAPDALSSKSHGTVTGERIEAS